MDRYIADRLYDIKLLLQDTNELLREMVEVNKELKRELKLSNKNSRG